MNRAQKRLNLKKEKDLQTFDERVQQQVLKILSQKADAIIGETIGNSLAATAVVLNEDYGMEQKKILNFVGAYNKVFEDVINDKRTWQEILALAEKLGVGGVKEPKVIAETLKEDPPDAKIN